MGRREAGSGATAAAPSVVLEIHVLGAGSALPTARRDTTSLLVVAGSDRTLVDCPGSVVHKLARRGIRPEQLDRVVLTHDHVDHVYGLPHLLHAMAVAGVAGTLTVHAPAATLGTVAGLVEAHGLTGKRYPPLDLRPIPPESGIPVLETESLILTAAPTLHGRDTRALRFATPVCAAAHSSDTRRSDALARFFAGADLLLHDCAGPHRDREAFAGNHSSAREAGEVAAAAGVGELRLVHLAPEGELDEARLVSEAAEVFGGRVETAADGDLYRLPRPGPVEA